MAPRPRLALRIPALLKQQGQIEPRRLFVYMRKVPFTRAKVITRHFQFFGGGIVIENGKKYLCSQIYVKTYLNE